MIVLVATFRKYHLFLIENSPKIEGSKQLHPIMDGEVGELAQHLLRKLNQCAQFKY